MGLVAGYYWKGRVIWINLRVDIKRAMVEVDLMAQRGSKETQSTRIASLAIRDPQLSPQQYIDALVSSFSE